MYFATEASEILMPNFRSSLRIRGAYAHLHLYNGYGSAFSAAGLATHHPQGARGNVHHNGVGSDLIDLQARM